MRTAISISAQITKTSASQLVSDRLFCSNQSKLTAWIKQTQARSELSAATAVPQALQLSPQLFQHHDKSSTEIFDLMTRLCDNVVHTGFALYEWSNSPTDEANSVSALLQALSLRDGDQGVIREAGALSLLQDLTGTPRGRFPPYQPKAMNWHTDGYYNDAAETIRCFTLHCVAPAADGGALLLMDDALLVLALWRENPELVALLSHPEAMTLPHNKDSDGHNRPDRTVPVIFRNTDETIAMRFTTRARNIQWRSDATQAAAQRASELISEHPEWHTRITLQQGQGIVTRNVLHAREKFVDAPDKPKRQILRGRFTSLPTPPKRVDPHDSSVRKSHVAR